MSNCRGVALHVWLKFHNPRGARIVVDGGQRKKVGLACSWKDHFEGIGRVIGKDGPASTQVLLPSPQVERRHPVHWAIVDLLASRIPIIKRIGKKIEIGEENRRVGRLHSQELLKTWGVTKGD